MKNYLFNNDRILSRNRYPWVDYARGITIILVVYRHVFEGLGEEVSAQYPSLEFFNAFFFSFRMPLFFMVSGLFFAQTFVRNGLPLYIKKRFSTIFYPLLIWGTIQVGLQLLLKNYVNADREPIDFLNLLIKPREIEQFWYLNSLFFVGLLYALLTYYLKFQVKHQVFLGLILFVSSGIISYLMGLEGEYPWKLGFLYDVAYFYVFFALGDALSKVVLNPQNYQKLTSFKFLFLLLPVFIITQYFFTEINLNHKDDYYVQYRIPWFYIVAAIIGGALIILLSFLLEKFAILKFLRVIGYHSLYIYASHLLVTAGTRIIFKNVLHIEYPPAIMVAGLFFGIVIPIVLYNLSVRNNFWWLFSSMPTPDVKRKSH